MSERPVCVISDHVQRLTPNTPACKAPGVRQVTGQAIKPAHMLPCVQISGEKEFRDTKNLS